MSDIDELMKELSENNFVSNSVSSAINADLFNQVSKIIGCEKNLTIDKQNPGGNDGSNLFKVLMYQNLLLAKRVEALEEEIKTLKLK